DRSDCDRLRRRWRECVFRRVIERRAVVALDRFAQTGLSGRKREASDYVLIVDAELEVTVDESRLAERLRIDPVNRFSRAPVDVVTGDVGRRGLIHIPRWLIPGDFDPVLELFRI